MIFLAGHYEYVMDHGVKRRLVATVAEEVDGEIIVDKDYEEMIYPEEIFLILNK